MLGGKQKKDWTFVGRGGVCQTPKCRTIKCSRSEKWGKTGTLHRNSTQKKKKKTRGRPIDKSTRRGRLGGPEVGGGGCTWKKTLVGGTHPRKKKKQTKKTVPPLKPSRGKDLMKNGQVQTWGGGGNHQAPNSRISNGTVPQKGDRGVGVTKGLARTKKKIGD